MTSVLIPLVLALIVGVVGASIGRRHTYPDLWPGGPGGSGSGSGVAALAQAAARRAGLRCRLAIIVSAVSLAVSVALAQAEPQLLGLPLAVGPGLAAALGLLTFAALPSPTQARLPLTSASLRRRRPWSFGPARAYGVPVVLATALACFLVWTATIATRDPEGGGRSYALASADHQVGSSAGPFPGWFYAAPLLVVTVFLLAAALAALTRIAQLPALPMLDLARADAAWRLGCTHVVIRLTTAALLGYTGGTVAAAGSAMRRAMLTLGANGYPPAASHLAGATVLLGLGLVLVLLGMVVSGRALAAALAVRSLTLRAAVEQADVASAVR